MYGILRLNFIVFDWLQRWHTRHAGLSFAQSEGNSDHCKQTAVWFKENQRDYDAQRHCHYCYGIWRTQFFNEIKKIYFYHNTEQRRKLRTCEIYHDGWKRHICGNDQRNLFRLNPKCKPIELLFVAQINRNPL